MNTIIIYASKYGCTKDCAEYLKKQLPGSTTLADAERMNGREIGLEAYDTVIIGGSVYVGKISKKVRSFCDANVDLLMHKKVALFLCCGMPEEVNSYFSGNFPAAVAERAVAAEAFGGEARMNRMKAVDRFIMKTVTKGKYEEMKVSREVMDEFVKKVIS